MKTFKLAMLIVACGLISMSCSNEELSIDNTATESELFSKKPKGPGEAGIQLYHPTFLEFNTAGVEHVNVTLAPLANVRRGTIGILSHVDGKTADDLIFELRVNGEIEEYTGGTQFARLGLYPGLKKPDMGGQCYNGEIIMKEVDGLNVKYFFYYDIISDKEIILGCGTCQMKDQCL